MKTKREFRRGLLDGFLTVTDHDGSTYLRHDAIKVQLVNDNLAKVTFYWQGTETISIDADWIPGGEIWIKGIEGRMEFHLEV